MQIAIDIPIDIPDDMGQLLAAQVQEMLELRSRWETDAFLQRAGAFHDYTMDDLERDIAAIRDATRG